MNKGEGKGIVVDMPVLGDSRTSDKEKEKVEKYQDLKREMKRIWNKRSVIVVPVIVGARRNWMNGSESWISH